MKYCLCFTSGKPLGGYLYEIEAFWVRDLLAAFIDFYDAKFSSAVKDFMGRPRCCVHKTFWGLLFLKSI